MSFKIKWKWFRNLFKDSKLYETYNQVEGVFKEPNMLCAIEPYKAKVITKNTTLPWWLRFSFENCELGWKTKWRMYRYETHPYMRLTVFGLSIKIWLDPPLDEEGRPYCEYDYWEAILNYIDCKDIDKVKKRMGVWKAWKGNYEIEYYACQDGMLEDHFIKSQANGPNIE